MKRILYSTEQDKLLFKTQWIPQKNVRISIRIILINRIIVFSHGENPKMRLLTVQIDVGRSSENDPTDFWEANVHRNSSKTSFTPKSPKIPDRKAGTPKTYRWWEKKKSLDWQWKRYSDQNERKTNKPRISPL